MAVALNARMRLASLGVLARVISMPCVEAFRSEVEGYRDSVLPPGVRRVVIEAARVEPWSEIVGKSALRIGLDHFGASAPASVIADKLGFTGESIAERIQRWLGRA